MNLRLCSSLLILTALLPVLSRAQDAPKQAGYRVLMVTQSKGFKHGSVSRKEDKLAPSEQAVTEIGIRSNLFRTDCTQDCEKDFTKENLANYDIVFFYTTGDLPIKEEVREYFYNEWLKKRGMRSLVLTRLRIRTTTTNAIGT